MPIIIDNREVGAVLEALRAISVYLGNESEYKRFKGWTKQAEECEAKPSLDYIAGNTPHFIRALAPALRRLYGDGYNSGFEDAGVLWHSIFSPRIE